LNLKGANAESKKKREKKNKKNGSQHQTKDLTGPHATPLRRGCQDLSNTTLESII